MNLMRRLVSMITVMNITAICFYKLFDIKRIKDVLSATTMIIFLMVYSFWLSADIFQAYEEMLNSFGIHISNKTLMYFVCFVVDMIIHVLPLIIVGLPEKKISIIIALVLISIWYVVVHKNVAEIYTPIVGLKLHYTMMFVYCCVLILLVIDSVL